MAPLPPVDYLTDRSASFRAACASTLLRAHDAYLASSGAVRPRGGRWHEGFLPEAVRAPLGPLPPSTDVQDVRPPLGSANVAAATATRPAPASAPAPAAPRSSRGVGLAAAGLRTPGPAPHPTHAFGDSLHLRQHAQRQIAAHTGGPGASGGQGTQALPLPHQISFLLQVACELDVALRTRRSSGPKPWNDVRRALQAAIGKDINDHALSQVTGQARYCCAHHVVWQIMICSGMGGWGG